MRPDAAFPQWREIKSASNPVLKQLRTLDRKKTRTETGLFLTEGARHLAEALKHGWSPSVVLVADAVFGRPYVQTLLGDAAAVGADIIVTSEALLSGIAKRDNAQTVIAAIRQRGVDLSALPATGKRYIALWEPRDPGNLGTILRTCDAAGVDGLVLIGTSCDPFAVETVRASMGSLFAQPFARAEYRAFDAWRQAAGLRLIAGSVNASLRPDETDLSSPSVILMGNEQSGIPAEVEAQCDALMRLPMRGHADSLNLATATGLLVYEAWRQRGFEGAHT
jgi:TrmH family RNA methyltransferase